MRSAIARSAWSLLLLLSLACATVSGPDAGRSDATGHVRLVPREGVEVGGGGGSYGDRRLRDVRLVDYSRPGFVVVYLDAGEAPGGDVELLIRESRLGVSLEPERAAVGAGGRIVVDNRSESTQLLSYPRAKRLERLEPGARVQLPVVGEGEQRVFLLGAQQASATVFAAPGPHDVVSPSGAFALRNLAPGPGRLRAWHPRFPPTSLEVELEPDARHEFELRIGVGTEAMHDGAE